MILSGDDAHAHTPEGRLVSVPIREVVAALRAPDVVRELVHVPGVVHCRALGARGLAVLHESAPAVRSVRWTSAERLEDVNRQAPPDYRRVRIALPYVVTLTVFDLRPLPEGGVAAQLSNWCEVFFANEPLAQLDQEIRGPALLNTTHYRPPAPHPLALLCTLHVDRHKIAAERGVNRQVRAGVQAVVGHVFDAGFNFDAELHGLKSWYSASREAGIDARIETVDAWECASAADPGFALGVPWLATGVTYRRYLDRVAEQFGRGTPSPATAAGFRELLFREAMRRSSAS